MTVEHAGMQPYPSIDAVRQANDELIAKFPEEDSSWVENERRATEARSFEFIARIVETGTVLDVPADRKIAQGFINYWTARPYTGSTDHGATCPPLGSANTLLKPFDAGIMRSIVERSDTFFLSQAAKNQALVKRILLRLLRLSDGSRRSLPQIKTDLLSVNKAKSESEVIEKLCAAGTLVITATRQAIFVELRYEALVRHWPRLRDWIDERIRFREAALFWLRTGRDKGALLSASLAKSAEEYGDLNDLEKEFVSKCRTHSTHRRFALAAAAIFFLVSPAAAWFTYKELYIAWRTPAKIAMSKSRDKPIESRVEAIRWLAKAGREKLDLSDLSLQAKGSEQVNLKGLVLPRQWNFERAELTNVDFGKAALPAAEFVESAIVNSHFDNEAKLEDTDFSRAKISDTSFFKSNLSHAIFDLAQLCHVDFSEADVKDASFSGVGYDALPTFKKTAWWLASGWTLKQVDELTKQFGGRNPDIPSYGKELSRFQKLPEANGGPVTLEYVKVQDGIAWTYATYGIELDKAEAASRLAVDGVTKLKGVGDDHMRKLRSYTADTLGYILLQEGQIEEAKGILKEAAEFGDNPGAMFRYGLVLSKFGDEEEALGKLNLAIDRGYLPSHELYLLRDIFSDGLETALNEKLAFPPSSNRCH